MFCHFAVDCFCPGASEGGPEADHGISFFCQRRLRAFRRILESCESISGAKSRRPAGFRIIWNSLFNSIVTLVAVLFLSFTLGYLLSHYRFRGHRLIYTTLMAGMMIPVYGLIVPIFMQEKMLGILNFRWSLIPVYTAVEMPLAVLLIRSYLNGISIKLEEAAETDGAPLLQTMYHIMFPVCRPVMTTIAILTFMHTWNEFPFARVLILKDALKTIPIGLTYFTSQYTTDYTLLFAALAMVTLPLLILYLFCYRNVMKGMMAGAVKG